MPEQDLYNDTNNRDANMKGGNPIEPYLKKMDYILTTKKVRTSLSQG